MNKLQVIPDQTLPALLDRASAALAAARTSAELLEVRDYTRVVYDAAKAAGRMARAKQAHDDVIAAVYRAQADALLIEARAKMRLADEYDAAQERGEVATRQNNPGSGGHVGDHNMPPATAADLGLRRDEIHEARKLRDAEAADPGWTERALREIVTRGEEPTRAALKKHVHVAQNSGNNEWYTPREFVEAARCVLGHFDLDPASSEIANRTVMAYHIFTAEDDGLAQEWPIGRIWMNPPYASNLIGQFASKFAAAVRAGSTGIVLVNNATETGWFQEIAAECSAICFPKARIKFLDTQGNATGAPLQGQAVIYCGPRPDDFEAEFSRFGLVVRHEKP
jgi:phage N-6-adenine-methyltransferase